MYFFCVEAEKGVGEWKCEKRPQRACSRVVKTKTGREYEWLILNRNLRAEVVWSAKTSNLCMDKPVPPPTSLFQSLLLACLSAGQVTQ